MLTSTMARHAIAATGRNAGLQVRDGGMAEGAVAIMGDSDRCIRGSTGVMTAGTGCPVDVLNATDRHRACSNMVCVRHRLI